MEEPIVITYKEHNLSLHAVADELRDIGDLIRSRLKDMRKIQRHQKSDALAFAIAYLENVTGQCDVSYHALRMESEEREPQYAKNWVLKARRPKKD